MGAIVRILGMAFGAAFVDVLATAIVPPLGIILTIASIVWIINMVVDVMYKISHLG